MTRQDIERLLLAAPNETTLTVLGQRAFVRQTRKRGTRVFLDGTTPGVAYNAGDAAFLLMAHDRGRVFGHGARPAMDGPEREASTERERDEEASR